MPCTRLTANKYKNRPGPPYHAGDCKGQKKTGNDGKLYSSEPTAKGVYRWVPTSAQSKATRRGRKHTMSGSPKQMIRERGGMGGQLSPKEYLPQFNGAHPYRVQQSPSDIHVIYQEFDYSDGDFNEIKKHPIKETPIYSHKYTQVWIADGFDSYTKRIVNEFKGNTVVAQIAKDRCVYIGGDCIKEFEIVSGDDVTNAILSSPMGNSGVPYPYLVGATHTYFLLDFVAVPNELFDTKKDRYAQFYGQWPGADGEKVDMKPRAKKLKIKKIHTPR
jgi:hypothetical protein